MASIKTLSNISRIGAGLAMAGMLYDSHRHGNLVSAVYTEKKEAQAYTSAFNESKYLNSSSQIKARYKNWLRRAKWNNTARPFCNAVVGYFKGVNDSLADKAIPAALATATLLMPKGIPTVISASALGLYGVMDFMKTTFGVGDIKRYTK